MSFVSYEFILFIFVIIALYFIFPLRIRYMVLLAGSLFFYSRAGYRGMFFLLGATGVTYICGIIIGYYRGNVSLYKQPNSLHVYEKNIGANNKRDRKEAALLTLIVGLLLLFTMLIYSKTASRLLAVIEHIKGGGSITIPIIIPLGISYYTFAAVGYLADVYWKKEPAERNPLKLMLYLCYFPQILQGPIPKHRTLAPQLSEGHKFSYERVCFGMQRVVWGFFKKLVIADRLAIMVNEVFGNYLDYTGIIFVFGLAGAVFQLYADFSGCMDIALGVSEIFGITLEENFKRPFFATSAAEFWRRWHISLGSWFKDYVYMPISVSPWLMEIGKFFRKHGGRSVARNIMTTIPLLIVWFLTGLWHGTGLDYIVWGFYWGGIIVLSTWLAPIYRSLNTRFGLNNNLTWWRVARQFRTFGLYMVGRLLTLPGNLATSRWIGRKIFTWNPWVIFDGTLLELGWNYKDALVGVISLLIVWRVSILQERGVHIRELIAKWPLLVRWVVYYGAVFAVLIFGIYGSGASASSFVYMNF